MLVLYSADLFRKLKSRLHVCVRIDTVAAEASFTHTHTYIVRFVFDLHTLNTDTTCHSTFPPQDVQLVCSDPDGTQSISLWVNYTKGHSKPTRIKGVNFIDSGITIDMPKSLTIASIALRVRYSPTSMSLKTPEKVRRGKSWLGHHERLLGLFATFSTTHDRKVHTYVFIRARKGVRCIDFDD